MKGDSGFTLAETLITLVIVGVVAALTVPTLIAKYNEEQTVAKVKKIYSSVAQVVQQYQFEYSCMGNIANCFQSSDSYYTKDFYQRFEKKFNIVDKIYPNTSLKNVNWLPDYVTNINGTKNTYIYVGVYKAAHSEASTIYALADGSIFRIQMPDTKKTKWFYLD